ncbi:MAG: 30S ribosomal protein S6 [Candidatus Pacebacteria bacterium]|nr:30S ribosomal protein S6 [Candidatus Paceibacterota bacterium]
MQDSEKEQEIAPKNEAKNSSDSRVYEVGYLLVPTIEEGEVPAVYSAIKDVVVGLGGEMISDEMPRMIPLAYTMLHVVSNVRSKFDNAYFGWVKFEMNPDKITELKSKLDLDPKVIRFLITKTVKENTIAAKRFVYKDSARRKTPMQKKDENEVVAPINKEEVDKEIEAMVATV